MSKNAKRQVVTYLSCHSQSHISKIKCQFIYFLNERNYIKGKHQMAYMDIYTVYLDYYSLENFASYQFNCNVIKPLSLLGGAIWLRLAGRTAAGKPTGRNLQSCCSNTDPWADDWPPADLSHSACCYHPTSWWRYSTQVGGMGNHLEMLLLATFFIFYFHYCFQMSTSLLLKI